jgi:hypothetical protein
VDVVANYDGFVLAPGLEDDWANLAREMTERYYGQVTRYATGAFKRRKGLSAL